MSIKLKKAVATSDWLGREVCPGIAASFEDEDTSVAAILGKALLRACFEESVVDQVPPDLRHEIVVEYIRLETSNGDEYNPIERV